MLEAADERLKAGSRSGRSLVDPASSRGAPRLIPSQRGDFVLDESILVQPRLSRVVRDGEASPLERKSIELLSLLSRRRGEVVSRQEILDQIWAGVHVTEDALYRTVSLIRSAIEDDPAHPERLQTIRKVGYQLVADVDWSPSPSPSRAPEAARRDESGPETRPARRGARASSARREAMEAHGDAVRHARVWIWGSIVAASVIAAWLGGGSLFGPRPEVPARATEPAPRDPRLSLIDPLTREADSLERDGSLASPKRRLHVAETLSRMGRPVEARRLVAPLIDEPSLQPELRVRALAADAGALLWLGRTESAEQRARAAHELASSSRPPLQPRVLAGAELILGTVVTELGRREGLAYLNSALSRVRGSLGNEDPMTARAIYFLALGYWQVDELLEAELYARQALALADRVGDLDPIFRAEAEDLLAATLWKLGRHDESLRWMRSAFDHFSTVTRDDRSLVASRMLSNLGASYLHQERYATTIDFARRALDVADQVTPGDLPGKASALQVLAFAHWKLGDLETAESVQRENLDMRRRLTGDQDPFYASALHNLALIRLDQGEAPEAEDLARRALEIRLRAFGEDNLSTAYTLVALGRIALVADRADRAEELFRQALDTRRRQLGDTAPLVRETEEWLLRAVEAESSSITAVLERR